MKTRLANLWESFRTGYWFVPTIMTVGSFALWVLMLLIEEPVQGQLVNRLGWVFGGGPEGVRGVLSAIAGSMITVTGVVFSVTIVSLTLASQQFGPRLLRHFMRDRGNQIVLGTFISTFLYCLLVLRTIRGTEETTYVPHISATVGVILAVASVGVLIYFIHHVAALMQAPRIVAEVAEELSTTIETSFPDAAEKDGEGNPVAEVVQIPRCFDVESRPVRYHKNGYLQVIDKESLMEKAEKYDLLLRLTFRAGDFIVAGSTVAMVWPGDILDERLEEEVANTFIVGPVRTPTQDPGFLFDELAEVAVRSLSPSVNDPFTAMNCIDHLSAALVKLGNRPPRSIYLHGESGELRIIANFLTFEEALRKSFDHIRQYSASSAPVTNHLLDTLQAIALLLQPERRHQLLQQATMINRGSRYLTEKHDRAEAGARFKAFTEILKHDQR